MAKTKKNIQKDEDTLLEEDTKDLDTEDIDLGDDEMTAGDIPERYYKSTNQKDKDDARKSFERDYSDVMDYEE